MQSSALLTHACQGDKPKEEVKCLPHYWFFRREKYARRDCDEFSKFLEVIAEPDKGGLKPEISDLSVNLAGAIGHSHRCCVLLVIWVMWA